MLRNQIIAIAVVSLVILGGAAAVGAASPADAANETAANVTNESPDEAGPPDEPGASIDAHGDVPDRAVEVGPPEDLPEMVPDHVNAIHETIEAFLSDATDHLGHTLADSLGEQSGDE